VFIATDDDSFDDGGSLFESTDGGVTWVQLNVPFSLYNPFNGLFFLDSQNGWVYGNENYRTTDGGTTWVQLPFLGSTYFMRFYSTTFGLATGNFERYVSHDGGLSWVPSPNDIFSFDFADFTTGLGVSETGIYRTTDGGGTFTLVHSGDAEAVAFLSNSVAVGIVDGAFVYSTDGGQTWTSGASANDRTELQRVTENVVLAWGRTGFYPNYDDRVLRSTDGGQTWTDLGEVVPEGVWAFSAPGAQMVVAADLSGNMHASTDDGLTWTRTFTSHGEQPGYLSSAQPSFPDPLTGYFGYGSGFVIKTTDGGATWSQISSGTGQSLHDVARFSNGMMIAVGDQGTLLTSDGVSPWVVHESFTTVSLNAVHVINENEAAVVDDAAQLYVTTDQGASWTASGTPPDLESATDLHFTTLLDGWVIGSGFGSGALHHTTDGGNSWTTVTDFSGLYVSVDVVGENIWAAGYGEFFYRSTDGGATWTQGELPWSPLAVRDMDFYDENIGYTVGGWNFSFRTEDGGVTWTILPQPDPDHDFTDISLIGPDEFWVSTNDDVAYYTNTGGLSWAVLPIESDGFGSFEAISATPQGDAWVVGYQGYVYSFEGQVGPLNIPPTAGFDFTPMGLTIAFTDTSTDPDGQVVSWLWDFGDDVTSTEQHPTHTYGMANTYIVSLIVTDDDGDADTTGALIVAQPGPGGTYGEFTEVTPLDSLFVTPQDEDFWVVTTAPADYDTDGDLDIAVLGYYVVYNVSAEDKLVLVRNDGEAGPNEWEFSYIDIPLGSLSTGASDLAWGDADSDGDLDLVLGTNGATVLYRNDAGSLVLTDTELPAYWEDNDQADFDLRSITWADYDNDADLDLLIPSVYDEATFSFVTALMRNDGSNGTGGWVFTETDSVFAATSHAQAHWADADGDQDLDLLLVNIAPLTEEGFIRRYRNEGGGAFTGEDVLGSLSVEHGEAQWGDYDGDGDLDILVAGNLREIDSTYTATALRIYRNDAESYVQVDVIECIPCEGWYDLTAATWADYDSDGDMDILLAGTYNSGSQIEGRAMIYTNDGTGVFAGSESELPAPRASGDRGGTFSWLDIDGEGDLDYFIAGQYFVPGGNGLVEAQMHVYRNDVQAQNNPPSMPGGLNAIVQADSSVVLEWLPASDDHTPGTAITYDLNLFRDGAPVALPRRTPEPGNVSAVTEWLLDGLAEGQYELTLMAVDASYSGGPVASCQFTIGGTASSDTEGLPLVYALDRNYPNPFNPATTFRFSVPEQTHVELAIYDLNGKLVDKLVNEERPPGVYEVRWDARSFASGTYFVSMKTTEYSRVQKIMLLK
jgi:photosystem II stability/assembly factor-like uncharacterized protein